MAPVAGPINITMMSKIQLLCIIKLGIPVCAKMYSGLITLVLYVIMPISMVLRAMAAISRLRFTP